MKAVISRQRLLWNTIRTKKQGQAVEIHRRCPKKLFNWTNINTTGDLRSLIRSNEVYPLKNHVGFVITVS